MTRPGPTTRLILKRREQLHASLRECTAKSPQPAQEPNEELQRAIEAMRIEEGVSAILGENLRAAAE